MLGAYHFTKSRFLSDALQLRRARREERNLSKRANDLSSSSDLDDSRTIRRAICPQVCNVSLK
jgi:hypothetical protein